MSITVLHYGSNTHPSLIYWGFALGWAMEEELNLFLLSRRYQLPAEKIVFSSLEENAAEAEADIEDVFEQLSEVSKFASEKWTDGGRGKPPQQVNVWKVPIDSPFSQLQSLGRSCGTTIYLVEKYESARSVENERVTELLEGASEGVVVIRPQIFDFTKSPRILIPVGGGPHARYALRLADKIARRTRGEIAPLLVETDIGDDSEAFGEVSLKRQLAKAGIAQDEHVKSQIRVASDVMSCVRSVAEEGFDLVLIGSSDVGRVRKLLFKTLSDRLLQGAGSTSIAVCRSPKSQTQRLKDFVEKVLVVTVPQLEREDRIRLFETLQGGSRWNFDFMTLLLLSTSIATIGLIQNSAAVVIGAMVVAPLMTPLLSAGLSLAQGNLPLFRTAAFSVGMGFVLAISVGFAFGSLFGPDEPTAEILARGGPTLLDMAVAFFSGIAAAHCVARPNLSAALAGVAIAAALVPPLSAIGLSLALGAYQNAEGAALLFGTNIVAIILGASVSIFAAGVRGKGKGSGGEAWARRSLVGLLLCALALAVPLSPVRIFKAASNAEVPDEILGKLSKIVADTLSGNNASLNVRTLGKKFAVEISFDTSRYPNEEQMQTIAHFVDANPSIEKITLHPNIVVR
ncbi:MAG: DUF389 domain-containing protein [Bdellovibrionales bacterium]|nr:DUF389 domain-containing protein [Bdellovibrionales bacterium]